jgi:hypothetical protein
MQLARDFRGAVVIWLRNGDTFEVQGGHSLATQNLQILATGLGSLTQQVQDALTPQVTVNVVGSAFQGLCHVASGGMCQCYGINFNFHVSYTRYRSLIGATFAFYVGCRFENNNLSAGITTLLSGGNNTIGIGTLLLTSCHIGDAISAIATHTAQWTGSLHRRLTTKHANARWFDALGTADLPNLRSLVGNGRVWSDLEAQRNLALVGFARLPNGLVVQWGNVNVPAGGNGTTVTLPLAMSSMFGAYATAIQAGASAIVTVRNEGAASFAITSSIAIAVRWFAIGRLDH